MTDSALDRTWMARALALAERGRGSVRPNPLVGCVLVRDGAVVGEGHHERPGSSHAEVVALAHAGDRAAGATAYVTLEPCDHTGRTGPCTQALMDAGVVRVVYAVADPNPVAGGGAERLSAAGIEVERGVLGGWAERQNELFLSIVRTGRPRVTLKLAQTTDGSLVGPEGRWVTGPLARTAVHRLRAASDAVLVGVGTVLADDPRLDVRHVALDPALQPRPVVLDTTGRTPVRAAVVRPGALLVTGPVVDDAWRDAVTAAGAEVVPVAAGADGHLDPAAALAALTALGIEELLAEPGAVLAGALVAARLVDRLVLHIADAGGRASDLPTMTACVRPPDDAGWRWETIAAGVLGPDLEVVAVPSDAPAEQRRSA